MHKNMIEVLIILNWLGREGLQVMQALNGEEQKKFKNSVGLFEVLTENVNPNIRDNLSLQYCKLINEQNESIKEWISCLRIMVDECK